MTAYFAEQISSLPRHATPGLLISDFIQNNALTTHDTIVVSWVSSLSEAFSVSYRISGTQGNPVSVPAALSGSTTHQVTIENLPSPDTSYDIMITSDSGVSAVIPATTLPASSLSNSIVMTYPALDGSTVLTGTSIRPEWTDFAFISTVGYDVIIRPDVPFTDSYSTTGVIYDSNGIGAQQSTEGQDPAIPRDGKTYYGQVIGNFRVNGSFQPIEDIFEAGRYANFSFKAAAPATITAPTGNANQDLVNFIDGLIPASKNTFFTAESWKGTSGGGYNAWVFNNGMYMAWAATNDPSYVQHAVDMAMSYVNAAEDIVGEALQENIVYQKNGYLDYRVGTLFGEADKDKINHYHYDWRTGAGIANAGLALIEQGGSGITPSNALSTMADFLRKHIWEKWSQNGSLPQSNVGSIYRLEAISSATMIGRVMQIAIFLAQFEPNPASNEYITFVNAALAHLNTNIPANGGWSELKFKTREPVKGTQPSNYIAMDVSHHNDVCAVLMIIERLNVATVTQATKDSIRALIDSRLYTTSKSNALFESEPSPQNWGRWSGLGAKWGAWMYYATPATLARMRTDYLAAGALNGGNRHIDIHNAAALLAGEAGGWG